MIPYRSKTIVNDSKHKYPFNKPVGINTTTEGVETFIDQLIDHVQEYYVDNVIESIQKPIAVNPEAELENLQFYEEKFYLRYQQNYEDILSSDVF